MHPKFHLDDFRLRVFGISIERCDSSLCAHDVLQEDVGRAAEDHSKSLFTADRVWPVNSSFEVLRFFVPKKFAILCNQFWQHSASLDIDFIHIKRRTPLRVKLAGGL